MKKILVLTGLSKNDSHLHHTSLMLAKCLSADILLFNNYQLLPITSFYGAGPWIGEDETRWELQSRLELEKTSLHLNQAIQRMLPGEQWRPRVSSEALEGSLAENVKYIIAHHDIELIVMGGSGDSRLEHLLFGSNISSVIAHATRPVLVLPAGVELNQIHKVFFATDYHCAEIKAISYLLQLGRLLRFKLEIVHVAVFDDMQSLEIQRKTEFLNLLKDLSYPGLEYTQVGGTEVVPKLIEMCTKQQGAVLGLVHQQDSLLIRIIRQSTVAELLERQALPMMVFPSKIV